MIANLLTLGAALYVAAAAASVAAFLRPALAPAARAGVALAAAGFAAHGLAIGLGCQAMGGERIASVAGTLGLGGWIGAGAFLAVHRAIPRPAVGAFALPLVALATLPVVVAPAAGQAVLAPALAALPALRLHVTTAAAGLALLALAAVLALMFLLQERELKGKRFGPLLTRLPSLHVLDRVNGRLLAAGFALFTVAMVSGSLLARAAWCAFWEWDAQQIASVATWLAFGGMVLARHAGSHGRRQAALTLVTGLVVIAGVVGARQVTTRHADLAASAPVACADPS